MDLKGYLYPHYEFYLLFDKYIKGSTINIYIKVPNISIVNKVKDVFAYLAEYT